MIEKEDAKKVIEVLGNNLIGVSHDSKNFLKLPDTFWGYFARGHDQKGAFGVIIVITSYSIHYTKLYDDYLQKEVQIIKPKIICVLGNTAFGSILGGNEITKHRGKIASKRNQLYFITIHPAATIYNQELNQVLKNDIKKLFTIISRITS